MAQILLHGNLHVTIFEASELANPGRASGGAPKFIRKVRFVSSSVFFFHFSPSRIDRSILATPNLACESRYTVNKWYIYRRQSRYAITTDEKTNGTSM